jgi:predicted metal-dependent phosphoesterase TrpH
MENVLSKADLHVHTTASDGTANAREVLAHVARQTDLRVIAITDHDTIASAREAQRMADAYGIEVIVGEEVSTREGHLLALFLEEELPPGRPLSETAAAARAQGALVVAPHPFGYLVRSIGRTGAFGLGLRAERSWVGLVDAVETWNAGLWSSRTNARAVRFAASRGLPAVGGSDSHHLRTLGLGYTLFPGRTAAELRQALLCGQTHAAGVLWGLRRSAEAGALIVWRNLSRGQAAAEQVGATASADERGKPVAAAIEPRSRIGTG